MWMWSYLIYLSVEIVPLPFLGLFNTHISSQLVPIPSPNPNLTHSIEHWHKTSVCDALAMDECGSQYSADFLQKAPGLRVCSEQLEENHPYMSRAACPHSLSPRVSSASGPAFHLHLVWGISVACLLPGNSTFSTSYCSFFTRRSLEVVFVAGPPPLKSLIICNV